MGRLVEILELNLPQYDVSYWDKTPVFNNYKRLVNYISSNLGDQYTGLLAMPKVLNPSSPETNVKWYSNNLGSHPKRLSELKGEEYTNYKQILSIKLESLQKFRNDIDAIGKDKRWAELIDLALIYPGEGYVFCGENDVSIAGWSLTLGTNVKTDPFEKTVPLISDSNSEDDQNNEKLVENEIESISEKVNEPEKKKSADPIDDVKNEEVDSSYEKDPKLLDDLGKQNTKSESGQSSGGNEGSNEKVKGGKKKFNYWPLLLILLLILLFTFLYKRCKNTATSQPLMPEVPGTIIPPAPEDVELDQDSVMNIVTDRLNILVKGDHPDLEKFAKDFKSIYKEESYKVIYYDTLTSRVQIQIPKSERENVQNNLKTQLNEYDLLIWTERVFDRNALPNDPGFKDRNKNWYINAIKAPKAWDVTYGDNNIIVAIIDSGFDLTHPELSERIYKPYNVVERNTNVLTDPNEKHGSHVAGTAIGTKDNNTGLSGIAPECKFMPIQVSDRNGIMTGTAIIDAVLYAVNQGADVVNLSLGMSVGPMVSNYPLYIQQGMIQTMYLDEEALWDEIFNIAETNNTTLVLAGGNENVLIGIDPMQRNNLGIKVSALDSRNQKADFSNFGDLSTISAPGVNIYSSVPGNQYESMQGTSMASPIVTGAVGLLKSIDNTATTEEIIEILTNTGKPISDANGYVGNLLQLDRALGVMESGEIPDLPSDSDDCNDVQRRIDELLQEIEQLKNQCPEIGAIQDTMKLPEVIDNLAFMEGRWKSTTGIVSTNGSSVVIYFDFDATSNGVITLIENGGNDCVSNLSVSNDRTSVFINQLSDATCDNSTTYRPYTFECSPDANGNASCIAKDKVYRANSFKFNLVKIR